MGELMELAKKKAELERMQECFVPKDPAMSMSLTCSVDKLLDLHEYDAIDDPEIAAALDYYKSLKVFAEAEEQKKRRVTMKIRDMVMGARGWRG